MSFAPLMALIGRFMACMGPLMAYSQDQRPLLPINEPLTHYSLCDSVLLLKKVTYMR